MLMLTLTSTLLALAFTSLKGGSCAGSNPEGINVQVLNNNIWEYTGAAGGGPDPGQSGAVTSATVATTSTTTIPTTSVTTEQGGGCPTKGQANCVGLEYQVCNYVGSPPRLGKCIPAVQQSNEYPAFSAIRGMDIGGVGVLTIMQIGRMSRRAQHIAISREHPSAAKSVFQPAGQVGFWDTRAENE